MSRKYKFHNLVEQGFITDPTYWKYGSPRNYADDQTVLKIDTDGIHLGMPAMSVAERMEL